MPMYQPTNLAAGEGGGQVLDLETAVKDGILGGGVAVVLDGPVSVLTPTTTTTNTSISVPHHQKLDLKSMIDELTSKLDVPTVFICPISLEPMQDPVTLCTGQTYERSNILRWLSMGRLTCPTTMQELWDDSLTPNATLRQLILAWFSQKYVAMRKRAEDVEGRVVEIVEGLRKAKGQAARVSALKELRRVVVVAGESEGEGGGGGGGGKKAVVERGGVGILVSLLGPFTTHAVGSEVVAILVNLKLDADAKANLLQPAKVSLMVDMLNEGSIETKINCTRLINTLIERKEEEESGPSAAAEVVSRLSLLVGLLRLIKDRRRHPNGVQPGLSLLKSIATTSSSDSSSSSSVRVSIVTIGAVPPLIDLLPNSNPECLELTLIILDALSCVPEGRLALKECPNTIANLVKLLMRVPEGCTQLALSVLWAVCKLSPEECAPVAVEAGLAAKLLLVIQSGCNPTLKQMSSELLKLCSLNYTASIFISKCKLTRTLQ